MQKSILKKKDIQLDLSKKTKEMNINEDYLHREKCIYFQSLNLKTAIKKVYNIEKFGLDYIKKEKPSFNIIDIKFC